MNKFLAVLLITLTFTTGVVYANSNVIINDTLVEPLANDNKINSLNKILKDDGRKEKVKSVSVNSTLRQIEVKFTKNTVIQGEFNEKFIDAIVGSFLDFKPAYYQQTIVDKNTLRINYYLY